MNPRSANADPTSAVDSDILHRQPTDLELTFRKASTDPVTACHLNKLIPGALMRDRRPFDAEREARAATQPDRRVGAL